MPRDHTAGREWSVLLMKSVDTIAFNASRALCPCVSSETTLDDVFEGCLWMARSEWQNASKLAPGVDGFRVTFYFAAYALLNVSK